MNNTRHMRRAASGLFNWAAEAGRDYVTASPCINLPKLDPEYPRTRGLSEDEIRIFWHGLDRNDLLWGRKTCLALKFELVTKLHSNELLGARRGELFDLDGEHPRFDVPLKRVKKRRVIQQPLSDLAVEIIKEALEDGNEHVFASPLGDQPMNRKIMAATLRGITRKGNVTSPGFCDILGLRTICAELPQRWQAISALMMHGLQSVLTMPQTGRASRSCQRLQARPTITPSG